MAKNRTKKVSYVLQVTCNKIPQMNENEFLAEVRRRLFDPTYYCDKHPSPIEFEGTHPRVSVYRKVEEYHAAIKEHK